MLTLPAAIIPILAPFATLFQSRTWLKAQVLLMGIILAPGKRTVTSALRVMGLSHDGAFGKYHHVLNRATWSSLKLGRVLLYLLLRHLASADAPLVFGIDETLERRRGQEAEYLERVDRSFAALPRVRVPLMSRDVEGLDGLREVGRHLLEGA